MKLTRRQKRNRMAKTAKLIFDREYAATCPRVGDALGDDYKERYAALYGFEVHERIFAKEEYWESETTQEVVEQRIMMLLFFAEVA